MAIQNAILFFLLLLSSCCSYRSVLGSFVATTTIQQNGEASLSYLDRSTGSINRRSRPFSTAKAFGSKAKQVSPSDENETQESETSKPTLAPKAWTIPQGVKFGRLDSLQLLPAIEQEQNVETIATTAATTTVATKAIGLNFADIFTVLGLYSAANLVRGKDLFAFVPGLEFSGKIRNDPTGTYEVGTRVLGFTRFGAYSELVSVPPEFLVPLPNAWSFAEGAGFLVQALTAWHGLVEIGRMPLVKKNDETSYVVIVHSASGGVGLWASELVARRGGIVLGIVRDESKAKVFQDRIVSKLSPKSKVMIRGTEKDFSERLAKELAKLHGCTNLQQEYSLSELAKGNHGADLVMESLGGDYFRASFDALNDGGSLVTFGSTTYSSPGRGGINLLRLIWRYLRRPRIDPGDLTARNLRLSGFNLIFLTEQKEKLREELSDCIACLSGEERNPGVDASSTLSLDKVTPPLIGATFDFQTQAVDAMEALKSGKTVGKVVLVNDDS